MNGPEQLAQKGIDCLEEAILDVLLEAKQNGKDFMPKADIERTLGIHNGWENFQFLCASVLYKLREDNRVWQNGPRGPWQLTDAEYNRRK